MTTSFLNILALLLGRFSGILAALLFLPVYHEILGGESFGVYAILLGVQAFGVMVDGGLATIVSRSAATEDDSKHLTLIRESMTLLSKLYIGVLLLSSLTLIYFPEYYELVIITIMLTFFIVAQNVYIYYLIGLGQKVRASIELALSSFLRPFVGLLALKFIGADVEIALLGHLSVAVFFAFNVNRNLYRNVLNVNQLDVRAKLIGNVRRLMFTGIAGASVTQLDKSILGLSLSPEVVSPYFLAMTLCTLPVSLFGVVLHQYFQPLISRSFSKKDYPGLQKVLLAFSKCLLGAAFLIVVGYNLLIDSFLLVWLGDDTLNENVRSFSDLFIYANILAMLSFLGFSVMNAAEDYRFQSVASTILAIAFLICLLVLSSYQLVMWVGALVIFYHATSFVLTTLRGGYLIWSQKYV
ncbi:lipopolysaccharide biosynthesis protein [Thalassolituus alkanivorans]|uniref:lipopolysaccharide biosynthesis protein n=1 Tax=Thalassolituus alkanivorans TaxID=2881055 RepID=UPI001E5E7617|nr:hypothetical protein [Thalassolituus alkanivorans]MCB2385710.1 hypothetical protein [Thalassolituus alkanivorans]MCB2424102.1 hypothetical protein [Thalassolituus alkanivorans]